MKYQQRPWKEEKEGESGGCGIWFWRGGGGGSGVAASYGSLLLLGLPTRHVPPVLSSCHCLTGLGSLLLPLPLHLDNITILISFSLSIYNYIILLLLLHFFVSSTSPPRSRQCHSVAAPTFYFTGLNNMQVFYYFILFLINFH